ncbi:MAG: glycoside hydrolase family 3 N-terminal domain-containing protein, partial [Glaciecola sp.]
HWGRVYEGFTEDRDLTTAAVIASVRGHQGRNLANRHTIAATAKHFIGDGATDGGVEGGNAVMTDELMRERYLPPYAAAVDQGVAAIMVGFNSYNDLNMHKHT